MVSGYNGSLECDLTEPLRKDFQFLIESVVGIYKKWLFQDGNILESWRIFSKRFENNQAFSEILNAVIREINDGKLSIDQLLELSVKNFDKRLGNAGLLKLFLEKKYFDQIDQVKASKNKRKRTLT